jgi:hypothetical protein
MANNPKKVKDPTEVALSAIQEALNIADAPAPSLNLDRADKNDRSERVSPTRSESIAPALSERIAPAYEDDTATDRIDFSHDEPAPSARRAASLSRRHRHRLQMARSSSRRAGAAASRMACSQSACQRGERGGRRT